MTKSSPLPKAATPDDKKKLEAEAVKVIEKARAIARKQVPYLETGLDALSFVFVHGIGMEFACDAKYRVFCDPAYVVQAGPHQIVSDILHEQIVHIMGDHFIRADEAKIAKEDRKLWNTAGDMAGNGTLFEIASKSSGLIRPMGVKFDEQGLAEAKLKTIMVTAENHKLPDGLTVEEYFQKLKEKQDPEDPDDGGDPGNEPGDKDGPEGDGPDGGEPGDGPPGKKPGKKPSKGHGKQKGEGGGDKTDPNDPTRKCGGCAGDTDHTDKLREQAQQQGQEIPDGRDLIEHESIKQRTAMAIEQHAQGRGDMPAGFKRWAEAVKKPAKVNWRKHLAAMVTKGVGKARGQQDFTQQKLRRRQSILLPTMYAPTPVVAMVLDTSGSMSDKDLGASMREVKGVFDVLRTGGATEVHIVACDTRATKPLKMSRWNEKAVQAILQGGGGTDMGAGIAAAATVNPSITVVCTDGNTLWPAQKPKSAGKVIVALTRPCGYPTPQWATAVKAYDEK